MAESSTRSEFPIGTFVLAGVLCAAAVYALGVTLMDAGLHALGRDTSHLESHLAAISILGMLTLLNHLEVLIAGAVLLLAAAWHFVRRGYRVDGLSVVALAGMALAASAFYATRAGEREVVAHSRAMQAAIERGDQKGLREAVFRCEAFCAFQSDSGPLVWLVAHAQSDADINAIGRMLQRKTPTDTPSAWLPDKRTAVQAAMDRQAAMPQLLEYVLGTRTM